MPFIKKKKKDNVSIDLFFFYNNTRRNIKFNNIIMINNII